MKSALRELYERYQAAGEFPSRLQIKRDMKALLAQEPCLDSELRKIWGDIYTRLLNGEVSYKSLEAIRRVMDEVVTRFATISTAHQLPRPEGCPTCSGRIKVTERRPDGDSICVNGHKHKTKEFYLHAEAKALPVENLAQKCAEFGKWLTRQHLDHPGGVMDIDDVRSMFISMVDKFKI